ncbi:glycosyltransferase family 2 protein, partial [Photobacterium damselae]|uniref:glycosyltransferase family 2 protein n=1 Tax=Photobacterium damselae TaxID=38293 RepID=UPI001EFC7C05
CIPTFNRCDELELLLISIYEELNNNKMLNENVKVYVSDNSSTDRTSITLAKYSERYDNFNYSINLENKGFGENLNIVTNMVTEGYFWIIGSDDTIINGAITDVFNRINKSVIDILLVSPSVNNKKVPFFRAECKYDKLNISTLNDFYRLISDFRQISSYFGFISSLVIKSDLWKNTIIDRYVETHDYTHLIK